MMTNKHSLPLRGKIYKVLNMDCASCAMVIEGELEDAGIKAKCSYAKCELEVEGKDIDHKKIQEVVKKAGYDIATP